MSRGQMIIVPAREPGRGGGHLTRCARLTKELREKERTAWLYLPSNSENTNNLLQSMNLNSEWRITEADLQRVRAEKTECIILDRFQTPQEELSGWRKIAPVIGIDEGGKFRDEFDFLIDILIPEKLGKPAANIANPSLLKFPSETQDKKQQTDDKLKILVSFGQEDSAGLGLAVAKILSKKFNHELVPTVRTRTLVPKVRTYGTDTNIIEITLLRGKLAKNNEVESLPNVRVLEAIPNLAERLAEYDLVITHYGITAYEALFADTAVLLVSPTAYHAKLAKAAGFYSIKNNAGLPRHLCKIITNEKENIEAKVRRTAGTNVREVRGKNLAELINEFSLQVNDKCSVCGKEKNKRSIARFEDRTYRKCPHCGVINMDRTIPASFNYGTEYFIENYKKQYGKTYFEDFPNLIAMAKKRLPKIKSLLGNTSKKPLLLEIGCSYGSFLAAAREEGFEPIGIDPAKDCVRYVKDTLDIQIVEGFFPETPIPVSGQFDVITLWLSLEHIQNCVPVFAEIYRLLKHVGILAFWTPSYSGVSGRSAMKKFLQISPADHFTIWSPKMCKKALAQKGFKVKKIIIQNHHPERFPLLGKLIKSYYNPLYWICYAISCLFGLADTFEIYAQKEK